MMDEDKRLDNVFKRKIESIQIEYREEDWIKARKMIDEDRRSSSNKRFFILFTLLSITGLVITGFWVFGTLSGIAGNVSLSRGTQYTDMNTGLEHANGTTEHAIANRTHTRKQQRSVDFSPSAMVNGGDIPLSRKHFMKQQERSRKKNKSIPRKSGQTTLPNENIGYILATPDSSLVASTPVLLHNRELSFLLHSKVHQPLFATTMFHCDSCPDSRIEYLAYHLKKHAGRSGLSIEAGLNTYNNGMNMHSGILYNRFLSPALSIHTGIGYTRIHQDLPVRVSSAADYSFGATPISRTIATRRLDYLEIPLNIAFHVRQQHAFIAGINYLHLLQSSDLITSFDQTGNKTEQKDKGYTKVFNKYDLQAHISYRLYLNKHWYVTAGYYKGLVDITNNTQYRILQRDQNSGYRLTLGLNIYGN